MTVPLLDKPKIEVALTLAILQEICESHLVYDPKWAGQIGDRAEILGLLSEITEKGLFRSVRTCVNKVTIHTLTLALNLPGTVEICDMNLNLFTNILRQLEVIPSNRFYSDSVCFLNPKARPKYCGDKKAFVKTYLCCVDTVKPQFGKIIPASRFDNNFSTGK